MARWGSSPSHCQLPWEPCGQGTTAISVTTSAEALPGPIPSLRWGPGLVDGAELGLHLGTCWCRAPVLQVPRAADVCQQQVVHRAATPQEGCTSHGHTGGGTALTPHPGAGLTARLEHILHPGEAECQTFSVPTATGLTLCWETTGER